MDQIDPIPRTRALSVVVPMVVKADWIDRCKPGKVSLIFAGEKVHPKWKIYRIYRLI